MQHIPKTALQVTLIPVSHPESESIVIEDRLFPIGRLEAPFVAFDGKAIARLSRRHARIFEEKGAIYLADLGSSNGTTLNGNAVAKKPVELNHGDQISFGGVLDYRVDLQKRLETSVASEETPSVRLTLSPSKSDAAIEPIVITQFPFLVRKSDDTFSRYKDTYPDEVNYISRRHAHIFLKHGDLYVEDLGSTNGTFVSGARLDEHAKLLGDDDTLAFGGDIFAYHVQVQRAEETKNANETSGTTASLASVQDSVSQDPKTTFINSATSFLEIFCEQIEDEDEAEKPPGVAKHDKETQDDASERTAGRSGGRPAWSLRIRTFLSELKGALAEEKPASPRRTWLVVLGVGALIGLLSVAAYIRGADEREIRALLAKGQYEQSALLANGYLKDRPDNESISALATEAFLKAVVPEWENKLKARRFEDADRWLAAARSLTENNQDGLRMLEQLAWVGGLEKFVSDRGGLDAPIVLFNHETRIEELLEQWDKDVTAHRHLLGRIRTQVPSFANRHSQTFSHVRALRNESSVYLKAILELRKDIKAKLEAGRPEELTPIFDQFAGRFPKVSGIDGLRADLAAYLAISKAGEERDLAEALRLRRNVGFKTPPFANKVKVSFDSALPTAQIIKRHEDAWDAWRSGNAERALTILDRLTREPWGEAATKKIEHYKAVTRGFDALKTDLGETQSTPRLLAFYGMLSADEDVYFRNLLDAEFQKEKENALQQAGEAFQLASQRWRGYRDGGGIGSLLRLEKHVSVSFRKQAKLLNEAHTQVTKGAKIYVLLQMEYPPDSGALREDIVSEVKRQRKWLVYLSNVLEPSQLHAKLRLLPELAESSQ